MTVPDLGERLRRRIRLEGPITLADYMTAALLDPAGGYYMRGDPFGRAGDFTTAPEISQMFGEMLGLWAVDAWQRVLGAPEALALVELGPGRGTLMADAWRAARVAPAFLEAARIHLVEASPGLRAKQEAALSGHAATWHGDTTTLPADVPLVIIANEFFDALPVRHFERRERGWHERLVGLDEAGDFAFVLGPPSLAAEAFIPESLRAAPIGNLVEVSPLAASLMGDLAGRITDQGGLILAVDYGRGQPAFGVSLQALKGHSRHDPLRAPGSADLTAHVDFSELRRAAEDAGAEVFGPVGQGDFLSALGIETRARTLCAGADAAKAEEIQAALSRLIDGEQMGELFKVLVAAAPGEPEPAPFARA